MQFAMPGLVADFLVRHPKVNVVAHATDEYVDIVGENSSIPLNDTLPCLSILLRPSVPLQLPSRRVGATPDRPYR
jgi:hypothetical protein